MIQTFKHRNAIISDVNVHDATLNGTSSSSNGGVIKLKDGWSDQTIRQCEIWDNLTWSGNSSCVSLAGQDQSSLGIDGTDVCYNKLQHPGTASQQAAPRMYTHNQSPALTNTHVYRNSLKGDVGGRTIWKNGLFDPTTTDTHENENNVSENGDMPVDTNIVNTSNACLLYTSDAADE